MAMSGLLRAFPQSACLARAHSAGLCFLDELPFEFVTPCEEGENLLGSHIVSTFLVRRTLEVNDHFPLLVLSPGAVPQFLGPGERPVHHQPYTLPPGRIALQVGQVPEEKSGKSSERERANLSHGYVVAEQCQVPKGVVAVGWCR